MSEKLITVGDKDKLWIHTIVSKDEVRGRHYRLYHDRTTKSGTRWVREPDLTLYQHPDEVWRTHRYEDISPGMKRYVADFDIRKDWKS